jgi:hypothetical protein
MFIQSKIAFKLSGNNRHIPKQLAIIAQIKAHKNLQFRALQKIAPHQKQTSKQHMKSGPKQPTVTDGERKQYFRVVARAMHNCRETLCHRNTPVWSSSQLNYLQLWCCPAASGCSFVHSDTTRTAQTHEPFERRKKWAAIRQNVGKWRHFLCITNWKQIRNWDG